MARPKKSGKVETGCGCKATKRLRVLGWMLLWATVVSSLFWMRETFKDYKRYELYPLFSNHEGTGAYKLDKHTGKVTAYYNLWEFKVQPFEEDEGTAEWSWLQRIEASKPLLYTEEYLQEVTKLPCNEAAQF